VTDVRRLWAIGLVVVLAAAPSASFAEEDAAVKEQATRLLHEGNRLVADGQYVQALEKFRAAYATYASAKILINIGSTLGEMGRFAEAIEAYERYLGDAEADPTLVPAVEQQLRAFEHRVAVLVIELNVAGAEIVINGKPVRADRPVRVDPGPRTIVAQKPGMVPATVTVTVAAGERRVVTLELEPAPAGAQEPALPPSSAIAPGDDSATASGSVAVRRSASRQGRLAGLVRIPVVLVPEVGSGVVAGLSYGIGRRLECTIAGVLGGRSPGVYAEARVFFTTGTWRPIAAIGIPVFFDGGTWPGVRGAVGLHWQLSARLFLSLEAGLEHYPTVSERFESTLFAPAVGFGAGF